MTCGQPYLLSTWRGSKTPFKPWNSSERPCWHSCWVMLWWKIEPTVSRGKGIWHPYRFTLEDFHWRPPPARWQSRDRFTDEEYGKLQLHQELEKRVEVFLEIAEARLEEIQKRMKGGEWEEEEENPLEFHTYWDMVHAYRRAIDGIMINIDEKAIHKTASEEDIRKSLEKLNKKIQEFIPQLEPIKQLAIDQKDEALYRELEEAQEISVVAQKGSLYGLGAPAQ